MDKTHDSNLKSWIEVDENSDFPIQNIPFGIYSPKGGGDLHVATAIGNYILDLAYLDEAGYFQNTEVEGTEVFHEPTLNAFMSLGRKAWKDTRNVISHLLNKDIEKLRDNKELRELVLIPMEEAVMEFPIDIGDYTDFYSSKEHASNVGTIFRGPENALMPNWLHLPIAYHGRASSVILDGGDIIRPKGQTKLPSAENPSFGDSKRMDFELEMGWVIGRKGRDIAPENAIEHLFGFTIYNDFTARDTLFAEMAARLGPAKGKDFDGGNSLGPWIVTMDEIGDPHNLEMTAHINGKEFSRGNSGQAYHKIEDCVAYVSRCETLHPGEILGSGTVGTGSGIESDYWLQDGDTVALTIDKIGTLTNKVFGPSARPYGETKDTNVQIN